MAVAAVLVVEGAMRLVSCLLLRPQQHHELQSCAVCDAVGGEGGPAELVELHTCGQRHIAASAGENCRNVAISWTAVGWAVGLAA